MGPIMLDVQGTELDDSDRQLLCHPAVGGVILFSRNYRNVAQLSALTAQIHRLREPRLLIAVDHEGGRVQRFRDGFTALPAAALIGQRYSSDPHGARALCADAGWIMAAELRACGVDMSFAPVLDLGGELSQVIGDRAFGVDPDQVISLARAYVSGMAKAGMGAVGKHFPGHGGVGADSHFELPVDSRDLETFLLEDLRPFAALADDDVAGMMTAHLLVPAVDQQAVSFSPYWIQTVLRERLGYRGAVFSDDLSMHGAHQVGTPTQRAQAALRAGCDMVLICNDRQAALEVISGVVAPEQEVAGQRALRSSRMARFRQRDVTVWPELCQLERYQQICQTLAQLNRAPELDLYDDNPA